MVKRVENIKVDDKKGYTDRQTNKYIDLYRIIEYIRMDSLHINSRVSLSLVVQDLTQ